MKPNPYELKQVYFDNIRNHGISQDGQDGHDGISQEVAEDLGLPTIEGTRALMSEIREVQTQPATERVTSPRPTRSQRPLGRLKLRGESEGEIEGPSEDWQITETQKQAGGIGLAAARRAYNAAKNKK